MTLDSRSGVAALSALPVTAALPALGEALARHRRAVLVAPPGSGKTTLVAPWLLASGLVPAGEIIVLQPRRVAARSVARFMAQMRGERVGATVGFQVRFEQEVSAQTRIRVVTEGILTARLQGSPDLAGVAAVVLDEFHERSIHADLALALLKEVQEVLRDDLIVIVMSATLDAEPIARFLGDCPVVRAEGRSYPVTTSFAEDGSSITPGMHPREVELRMARGVIDAIDMSEGDVLGFLPGVRLIEGTRDKLAHLTSRGIDVEVLHGSLGPREQDRVLQPGARRRVVLSTNIAETSVTIPGIRAVVDSGLAKVMRYDLAVGSGRLETSRISRASADQRRGRAGRLGPGHCVRLWTRFEDDRLTPFEAPEIRRVDLARTVLELASWGTAATTFGYFEAPELRALEDARRRLELMGALQGGRLTAMGKAIAAVPADPRIGAYLVAVAARAPRQVDEAASWAAVIESGEASGDVTEEVRRSAHLPHVERAARQLAARAGPRGQGDSAAPASSAGGLTKLDGPRMLLLAGYADRVGVRREGNRYALVGGRMAEADSHAEAIVALELEAGRRGEGALSRVLAYAPIERAWLENSAHYRVIDELVWDAGERRVVAFKTAYFIDLPLDRKSVPNRDRQRSGAILAERAALALGEVFGGIDGEDDNLLARLMTLARLNPQLSLPATREAWLAAALPAMAEGLSSYSELIKKPASSLERALLGTLGWEVERRLRDELPERLEVPSGSLLKLAYDPVGSPALAVKIQEVFGLQATPTVARGRLPVVMHLLSPAGRPLQVTTDLASFWTRTWPEVRSEMRARYPKHHWPEDPGRALPSARTRERRLKPDESER